jgi:hypothetical protein
MPGIEDADAHGGVVVLYTKSNTGGTPMQMRQAVVIALLAAGASAAHADTIFTVTATYDPFNTGNTTFTVDNLSSSVLTGVDVSSGSVVETMSNIAPDSSEVFTFNDQLGGPFIQAPGAKGLPDTTTYEVSASYLGNTLNSGNFSSLSNLTGKYVDFLGACWNNESCSVDPLGNYDLTDVVAQASTVPLPPSFALLASGLLGFAGRLIRRR